MEIKEKKLKAIKEGMEYITEEKAKAKEKGIRAEILAKKKPKKYL